MKGWAAVGISIALEDPRIALMRFTFSAKAFSSPLKLFSGLVDFSSTTCSTSSLDQVTIPFSKSLW
jgi:hypothetical protein